MDEAHYVRFCDLRRELDGTSPNIAHVFVPVGEERGGRAPFRILFVGRATRDYAERRLATYKGAVHRDMEIVRSLLPDRKGPFWQFVNDVLQGVLSGNGFDATNLDALMGWSNLAKVGDTKGNPTPESLAKQAGLCVDQLRSEIAFMLPDAIVLPTTNYAQDEILFPLFGKNNWSWDTMERDSVAFKRDPDSGTLVVWTNHPQSMGPPGYRAAATRMTIELVGKAITGQGLPRSVS